MGMFDSLIIELEGRELEIQTKRFDCILETYRPGDWIAGAAPGIRVYFDVLQLDGNGNLVYATNGVRTLTLFIVIAQGVFVTYQLCNDELITEKIEQTIRQLQAEWRDSARLQHVLIEALLAKQERIRLLQAQLRRATTVIDNARRLKNGDLLNSVFDRVHEETQRLIKGEDPLEIVASVLANEEAICGLLRDNADVDLLADYRL